MLLAVGEHVLEDWGPQCVRMATGLAGGVGGTEQEMCGALSGGTLIIGGLLGRASLADDDLPAVTLTARYRERFLAQFGSTQCARLRDIIHAPGGLGSCPVLVEQAAAVLLELLAGPEQESRTG